jgi:hypothetical protein
LQPVSPEENVVLGDVNSQQISDPQIGMQSVQTEIAPVERPESPIDSGVLSHDTNVRPVGMLVDSPLETYDTESVIYWLGNSHAPLRTAAKDELKRRGLSDDEIGIATRIAAGDVQTKLDLVDFIARSGKHDPRPWLLLLMNDPSRDVKLKAVSVLATINDPAVEQKLRSRIIDEPDPTVAFRIRRLLDLR